MMRVPLVALGLLPLLASCTSMRGAEPPNEALDRHEVTLRYGRTHLDSDMRPFDRGEGGAIEYSYGLPRSPWRFFAGFSQTSDDIQLDQTFTNSITGPFESPVRFQAQIGEIYGGVRHEWTLAKGWVKPYFGGGVSYTQGSIKSSPPPAVIQDPPAPSIFPPERIDDSDESFGGFAQAGVAFPIGDGFRLSADWRWLFLPEFDLFGEKRDAGYHFLGMGFGWRF